MIPQRGRKTEHTQENVEHLTEHRSKKGDRHQYYLLQLGIILVPKGTLPPPK